MPKPIEKGPFVFCPKTKRPIGYSQKWHWLNWIFPFVGLVALLWYLVRVLPKPSRAGYPCQRVAGPLAWGFIGYVLSFTTAILAFRKARRYLWQARYGLAIGCAVIAGIAALHSLQSSSPNAQATPWTPTDAPNTPIGIARGINPGRVVWVRDPNVTRWNGTTGYWWETNATDQVRVDAMMSQSMRKLTGTNDDAAAWSALFHSYNQTHSKGNVGYVAGEKIVIKINQNTARSGHALNGNTGNQNSINGNPQLIISTLRQLVNTVGVAQTNIFVYDISRYIADSVFNPCHAEFPQVHFIEVETGGNEGREPVPAEAQWTQNAITYSDPTRGCGRNLATFITGASYMINMAIMKNHGDVGPTLCAKNHFGTVHSINHGAIAPAGMGESNPLVDMLANQYLGERTVLFMIDTLYAADGPDASPSKWKMTPFNTNWPSSLLVSQDGVAIDSVGFDFINTEWGCDPYTDNMLHEAALANNPPSGKTYGPVSLGVHEHWNNATDKQYSRNLGTGSGIELVPVIFPSPPLGVVASASSNRIDLGWASLMGISSYNIRRGTNAGGPYAVIANSAAAHYADTAVVNGSNYYYVVSSVNALGESTNSVEVTARPGPPILLVNCGGVASGSFAADTNYVGGGTASNGSVIDTNGLTNPAPQAVYQTVRQGSFTYTFGGVIPGGSCTVRLHFAENYWTEAGKRVFNVTINGTQVLTNFDIVAVTGAKSKAAIREFSVTANVTGQIVINFATVTDQAECSGIEILVADPFAQWQSQNFGCSGCPQAAASADPDGDGMSNSQEYEAGTNPNSNSSALRIISTTRLANDIVVTWATTGGKTNAVQATLSGGSYPSNYTDITGPMIIAGIGDTATNYVDPGAASGSNRFYRVRLVP